MMDGVPDDLTKLGPDGFEALSQALGLCVLGPGLTVFGDGPDGGREATFNGPVPFPSAAEEWNGYGVLQAKYKSRTASTREDNRWFHDRVRVELSDWANPARRRFTLGLRPQYLIFATNVALSSTPGTGGKDAFEQFMLDYQDRLGLQGWRVWDSDQISRLLDKFPMVRSSYSGLITPNEVLAQIFNQLTAPVTVNVAPPAVTVNMTPPASIRPGEPGNESAFRETFDAAGGSDLIGSPLAYVETIHDGYMQRFDGGPAGVERVLCAPGGHPVVAMDRTVWDQLQAVGGRGGGVGCIGFPLAPAAGRPYISSHWTEIFLVGGTWGRPRNDERRSRLLWRADGHVVWRPEVVFDDEASRTSGWRVDSRTAAVMDLRLAVSGHVLVRADHLQVTEEGRARMLDAIAANGLDNFLHQLGQRYGCRPSASGWTEIDEDYRNTGRMATYEYLVEGPTGRIAIRAGLQLCLPASHSTEATVLTEVRIDFDAIRPTTEPRGSVVAVPADLAMPIDDLLAFLQLGWRTTTGSLLLSATPDPERIVPAGAPRVEFYVQNERPENCGDPRPRRLLEMVDLSRFGRARVRAPRALAIGITTPVDLSSEEVAQYAGPALEHMGRSFGFTSAAISADS